MTDSLEQLGMERIMEKHMRNLGAEPDLRAQFSIYEVRRHHRRSPAEGASFLTCVRACVRRLL